MTTFKLLTSENNCVTTLVWNSLYNVSIKSNITPKGDVEYTVNRSDVVSKTFSNLEQACSVYDTVIALLREKNDLLADMASI